MEDDGSPLNTIGKGFMKIFGKGRRPSGEDLTEQELMSMVNEGHENGVLQESEAAEHPFCEQLDLFTDYAAQENARLRQEAELKRERSLQEAALLLKRKYGRNALFRGMDLEEGATAIERNRQIGGHRA